MLDIKARRMTSIVATAFFIVASWLGPVCHAEPAAAASAPGVSSTGDVRLPASLPLIRETDASHSVGGTRWAALLVLTALACAGTVLVRRSRKRGASRGAGAFGWASMSQDKPARVVQSLRLTPKASAHVLQWQGREWFIACTDQAITVLGHEPGAPEATRSAPGPEAA